jgi:cobalt/nickel transport system permease protein
MLASVVGLQMGAFGVVLETVFSGISSLPFSTFVTIMQPIHLGIGIVEGLVTASVITFVYKARPEIVTNAAVTSATGTVSLRTIVMAFFAVALLTGGVVSWYASESPDGLEWSIKKVTGKEELEGAKGGLHSTLAAIQEKAAFLPDYSFKKPEAAKNEQETKPVEATTSFAVVEAQKEEPKKGGSKLGTSLSGVLGGFMTLALAGIIGFILKKQNRVG